MGCRILVAQDGRAALYCSTTDWAFGPLFESEEEASAFQEWLLEHPKAAGCHDYALTMGCRTTDARSYTDKGLEERVSEFRIKVGAQ